MRKRRSAGRRASLQCLVSEYSTYSAQVILILLDFSSAVSTESDNYASHHLIKDDLRLLSGTLFLWMFWPSFNSAQEWKTSVICSTYLSLAVSTVTAMALSALSSSKGKINLVSLRPGSSFRMNPTLHTDSGDNCFST